MQNREKSSRDLCRQTGGVSGVRKMQVIFIAVQDAVCRKQMAEVFIDVGHNIIVTNSTADALGRIPKNSAG